MKLKRACTEEINLQYLLDLPENYSSEKNWPLVIFLHGYGERGDNLELVRKHGLPELAGEGQQFPFFWQAHSVLLSSIGAAVSSFPWLKNFWRTTQLIRIEST